MRETGYYRVIFNGIWTTGLYSFDSDIKGGNVSYFWEIDGIKYQESELDAINENQLEEPI